MKPQLIFLLLISTATTLEAQTDSVSSNKLRTTDSLSAEAGILLPDSVSAKLSSPLLHLKSEIRVKFPVIFRGNQLSPPDIYQLSKYFFSREELLSGLSPAQLYFYKSNKTTLGSIMRDVYYNIPDFSLGEVGKYLTIGKKAAAVILAIISLLAL